jgi:hypothetical protein
MMQAAFPTDETLEVLALDLLGRYEREFGAVASPPVPVEQIVENVLDLGILWEAIDEGPDEHILAELVPESRTVVFNERRHLLIEQTPGLYNTILGHEAGHWEAHVPRGPTEQAPIPGLERSVSCVFRRSGHGPGRREAEAHRFMGCLLMPETLLLDEARSVDLYRWPALYQLRDLFQVTISALSIRLQQLGLLYVTDDGRLFRSRLEYMGQLRLSI